MTLPVAADTTSATWTASAVKVSSAFDCLTGSELSYDGRRLVKRKRALLGSNPPRNSRLETHSDGLGADRNWPAPTTGHCRATIFAGIGVDLPIPEKTHLATA